MVPVTVNTVWELFSGSFFVGFEVVGGINGNVDGINWCLRGINGDLGGIIGKVRGINCKIGGNKVSTHADQPSFLFPSS